MAKHPRKSHPALPIWLTVLGLFGLSALVMVLLRGKDIILLNPKGVVAGEQLRLLVTATLVMLEIAIPALFLFYYFAWRYRETNEKAAYDPNSKHSRIFSVAIWTFPTITAILLAVVLIPATYKLQPQKSINDVEEPLTIQVVAMRWKWLFIYPKHNIATVNYVQIPAHVPVQFELTADETPMSSFWIPHLGGMLYAMTEHVNRLNLMADTVGDYEGSAAEINGSGFAGMRFNTRVSTVEDFNTWVQQTRLASTELSAAEYNKLLEPSEHHLAMYFTNPDPTIYSTILSKYGEGHGHDAATEVHEGGH